MGCGEACHSFLCRAGRLVSIGYNLVRSSLVMSEDASRDKTIWLHGASVGEMKVLVHTYYALRKKEQDLRAVLTYTSPDGKREIRRIGEQVRSVLVTSVFGLSDRDVSKILQRYGIRALVIAEKDRYPHLILPAYLQKVPIVGLDTRLHHGSKGKSLLGLDKLCSLYSKVFVSRESDLLAAMRLCEKTTVQRTRPPKITIALESRKAVGNGRAWRRSRTRRIVAGSLHWQETNEILEGVYPLLIDGKFRLEIYPRYDRSRGCRHANRIQRCIQKFEGKHNCKLGDRVVVVDEFGSLFRAYRGAYCAIVGGSFYRRGKGHNFYEPIAWSVPTIIGPHLGNWQEEAEEAAKGGVLRVCQGASCLAKMINSPIEAEVPARWLEERVGAIDMYADLILKMIQ